MKIYINLDEEIQPALQRHLESGESVQEYIRAALRFFNDAMKNEQTGYIIGFGHKDRFKQYNTEMSPTQYLLNS